MCFWTSLNRQSKMFNHFSSISKAFIATKNNLQLINKKLNKRECLVVQMQFMSVLLNYFKKLKFSKLILQPPF